MTDRLSALRAALQKQQLDGFILPVNDEFMGEYVPDCAKRLTWLTGFTGSAGLAVVLTGSDGLGGAKATTSQGEVSRSETGGSVSPYAKAAFFTDGRYTLQAKAEVNQGYELLNSAEVTPQEWIAKQASSKITVGYDPKLHALASIRRFEKAAPHVVWKAVMPNPIDALWDNRPPAPANPVRVQSLALAGESSDAKRKRIGADVAAQGAGLAILTAADSICWLLNIRGSDVPFTPFVLCYAMLTTSGEMTVYLDEARASSEVKVHMGSGVTFKAPSALAADLAALAGARVLYDAAHSPIWFYQQLKQAGAEVIEASDPCQLPKAQKNKTELEGMREAHRRDGLAVTKFLCWLKNADVKTLSEKDVALKLEEFRKASNLYLEPSFTTIAGSGPNGAIVHYRVTDATNRTLDANSLLLVDSGGQYSDGTTDITRTVAIGSPSAEMKDRFTRVLKGHIAIARAVFPEGTTGTQLDALARQYLWQVGLDYDHGTGHGVGSYLSVHEGPQGISKRASTVALVAGMILSNEPGYYKTGEYGIRIESLLVVKEISKGTDGKRYLGFETITLAPIDMRLVEKTMLTTEEAKWLSDYHRKVLDTHLGGLEDKEKQLLNSILQA